MKTKLIIGIGVRNIMIISVPPNLLVILSL